MSAPFSIPKTINGYDLFETTSSFQKAIRRCDENNAMFWAVEMYNTGRVGKMDFREYVWQRMFVMVSEDIGLANPMLVNQIWSLYQMYCYLKGKNNEPEKLHFTHAVLLLVRSPKSRLVDWGLIHHFRTHDSNLIEPMDCALDKHTRRGQKMGRGFDHFFAEGCKLNQHDKQDREDEYMESSRTILVGEPAKKDLFGNEAEEEQQP